MTMTDTDNVYDSGTFYGDINGNGINDDNDKGREERRYQVEINMFDARYSFPSGDFTDRDELKQHQI